MPTEEQSSTRSHQGVPQGGVELSLDELAKGLATGTLSRGKAIRWMGGALLGAALASVPGVAWANDCRRLGRECRRDSQCCSKNCIRQGDVKVCACPEGKTPCNERCVNLDRNENHCGECFNRCAEETTCVNGACCPNAQVCGTGTTLACCTVEEQCVDGVCGSACGSLVPNGDPCTAASECCSGNCSNNVCCASGYVGLSNGTCAKPCTTSFEDCPNCSVGCVTDTGATSPPFNFCSAGRPSPTTLFCSNDNDCPKGQFCRLSGAGDRCEVAC